MKRKVKRNYRVIIFIILCITIAMICQTLNYVKNKKITIGREERVNDRLEMQEDDYQLDIMEANVEYMSESNIEEVEEKSDRNIDTVSVETETTNTNIQTIAQEEIRKIEPHIDSETKVKYITYEDVGRVQNGEDCYSIIKETHEIANQNDYEVRATLNEYHIYGENSTKPIYIKTNTNWNGAEFIIHDEEIANYDSKNYSLFEISSPKSSITITDKTILSQIELTKRTKKIEQLKGYGNCLCIAYNSNKKQFIRSGTNQNIGASQEDVFRIDNEGNILNDIKWDFEQVTSIKLVTIPEEQIVIQNGNFQTNLDKNQYEQTSGYWNRNIRCNRSNTILKNINHTLDDENNLGGPYYGFLKISCVSDVELQECKLVAHKYEKTSNYDLILEDSTNIVLNKVTCDNIEENDRWGITGTNYTKDITYKNCILNRIDAHCGVHNLTIEDCTIGVKGITLNGTGKLQILNTTRIGGSSFVELRSDYGSTWDGDIQIENCQYHNINKSNRIIAHKVIYDEDGKPHNYGYETVMPNIYINGLQIQDTDMTNENMYIFYNNAIYTGNEEGNLKQAGYELPQEIIVHDYEISTQKSIKAFYQDFEELSNVKIKINIPGRPKLEMKTENNIEYINGELTNQNICLKLETKDKIQNEIQINGQAIKEKEAILKETGNYQIIVTSMDSAGNTIQDQYEVKIDKKEPKINGIEENKIYEQGVTPIIEDENLDLVTLYYNENVVKDYKINTQLTKEGKYKIEATDKAGNKKIVSFEIQSPEKIENIKQYRVKETYITEILPTTTRQEFFKNASLNSKLKIYHEGKEITDVEIIKTGDILRINNQDYTLIVKADPSGDGKTSILDLMKVKRHIIGTNHLSEAALLAADLNEDGKVNIMDAMNFVRILTK